MYVNLVNIIYLKKLKSKNILKITQANCFINHVLLFEEAFDVFYLKTLGISSY